MAYETGLTPPFSTRLGTRLLTAVTLIVLALAASTGALVALGADRIIGHASRQSEAALLDRGAEALAEITTREARLIEAHLLRTGEVAREAADLARARLAAPLPAGAPLPVGVTAEGLSFDPDPDRVSDVIFSLDAPVDELSRDLALSEPLGTAFARWTARHPNVTAVYYDGGSGLTRYHPPVGLHALVPDGFDVGDVVDIWTERLADLPEDELWFSSPYPDLAGLGLMLSARAAVRAPDGELLASTGVDFSLSELQARLAGALLSPNSRVLLVDRDRNHVSSAGPGAPAASAGGPSLQELLDAMRVTAPGAAALLDAADEERAEALPVLEVTTVDGSGVLASVAAMPELGWTLIQLTPPSDLIGPSQRLVADIRDEADRVRQTVLALAVTLLLIGLLLLALLNHRLLLRPIAALMHATRQVAQGNYQHRLAHASPDELGLLATNFNTMTERLQESSTRYRTLFDRASDGILLHRDGVVLEANAFAAELLERPLASLPGTPIAVLRGAARAGDERGGYELWRRGEEGAFWVEVSESEVPLPGGAVRQLLFRDATAQVTARERLEEAVRQRTKDLQTLLELSNQTALSSGPDAANRLLARLESAIGRQVAITDGGASTEPPFGQAAFVPCVAGGRTVGVLHVDVSGRPLAEAEARLVHAFAAQVGVALEGDRLRHELQKRAVVEERNRIARELHDSVSQALFGIALGTKTALADLEPQSPARPALDYTLQLTEGGLAEMRALIFELRPESLEREGLVAALTRQLEVLERRHGLRVEAAMEREPELPLPIKVAMYRIAQEAMQNVIRHANATRVALELAEVESGWRLTVKDDGRGFEQGGDFPGHLGLVSMRERAAAVGASLDVSSRLGAGTTVEMTARDPVTMEARPTVLP